MNDVATPTLPATLPASPRPTALLPRTLDEAMRYAELIAKSAMVPAPFRNKPADVLIAIQMGAELGLAPMQAIQNIAVIGGRPSVYGDALMALVRTSPLCESVTEHYEGEGEQLTAVCIAKRRGQADPVVGRFSIADAKRAKLWNKAGPWTEYPKVMLKHRARGFALRDAFADLLRGLITVEEARDYPEAEPMRDVTPKADLDAFAAAAPPALPPHDPESGEIVESGEESVAEALRTAAERGTTTLKMRWNLLSKAQRKEHAHLIGSKDQPGDLRALAMEADRQREMDAKDDPFGLPPLPAEETAK